jgi:hypothetical protein
MTKIYVVGNCFGCPNKVYIGKTTNSRYNAHKRTFGEYITYTVIDEIDTMEQTYWKPLESYWIEQFRHWGFLVMNKNNGGSGPSYLNEEQKVNLRVPKKNKENFSYPKTQNFIDSVTGKTKLHPESRNKKISESLKGRKKSDQHRENLSKSLKGKSNVKNKKPKPPGFGENLSRKLKGKTREDISKPILQYDLSGNFIQEFSSIINACIILFNDASKNPNITKCCQGKTKSAYNYVWKYKNNTRNQ